MITLGIREPAHDLDFTLVDELSSLAQRIEQRLRFWLQTWFLDTQAGLPYIPQLFGEPDDVRLAEQIITGAIESVPEVTEVQDIIVEYHPDTRSLDYSATVHSTYGTSVISRVFQSEEI